MQLGSLFTCLLYAAAVVVEAVPQYNSSEAAASSLITKRQRQYNRYIEDAIKTRNAGCTKNNIM